MRLDRIDCGILRALQADARVSNKELAAENGISPSTCLERVRRLKSSGVITGYRTMLDPAAIGVGVQAMIAIRLNRQTGVPIEQVRDRWLQLAEVVSVYVLAGALDHLVHVAVRDVDHLRTVLWESFISRSDVEHVETSLIFEYARTTSLPIYSGETRAS